MEASRSPSPASSQPRGGFDRELFAGLLNEGWQMSRVERIGLLHLVSCLRPRVAIEIGTADGGSLSAIARHSETVHTLDIHADRAERLGDHFTNVQFVPGRSEETLPPLLARLRAEGAGPDFVLIDGDHATGAVRRDIEKLLDGVRPLDRPIYVLMHDSFNPDCRHGITSADWGRNPHVHRVQLDYVPGVLLGPEMPSVAGQMWGGFALATLRLEPRETDAPVLVRPERSLFFETVRAHSVHHRGWRSQFGHFARALALNRRKPSPPH